MDVSDLGLLVLRVAAGLIFAAHGAQKAFGWWSGPGLAGWTGVMQHLGIRPYRWWAVVSTLAELVGGLLLAIGLLTPLAAAALIGQSVVIIVAVHWPKGFWNANGGLEFPLALAAGVLAIAAIGPGAISLDAAWGVALDGPVRLAAAVVGLAGGLLALAITRLAPHPQTTGDDSPKA
jgi:putative oxidoreductase